MNICRKNISVLYQLRWNVCFNCVKWLISQLADDYLQLLWSNQLIVLVIYQEKLTKIHFVYEMWLLCAFVYFIL